MTTTDTELLNTEAAARYTGLAANTLMIYRGRPGYGPAFVKLPGNRVAYKKADLDAYLAELDDTATALARRAVRMTAALADLSGDALDAQLSQLMRAEAIYRKESATAAVADWYQAISRLLLAEYARRGRKPTYRKSTRKARDEGPSPYL